MSLKETLTEAGFSENEAERLANDDWFAPRNSNKSAEEIKEKIKAIANTYLTTEAVIRKAVLSNPQFAGYDHQRVLQGIKDAYNCTAEDASKAVLSFPQFAGYDHQRVLRQLSRIGRIAGLNKNEVIERILENPVLAGYSAKRYLAAIDIGRELRKEGISDNVRITCIWFSYPSKSPYVPDTKRLRIAQAAKRGMNGEPPLMTAMRKRLRTAG